MRVGQNVLAAVKKKTSRATKILGKTLTSENILCRIVLFPLYCICRGVFFFVQTIFCIENGTFVEKLNTAFVLLTL